MAGDRLDLREEAGRRGQQSKNRQRRASSLQLRWERNQRVNLKEFGQNVHSLEMRCKNELNERSVFLAMLIYQERLAFC